MSGPVRYVRVDRPTISEDEWDALDAGKRPCGSTRPETLGYQRCWRVVGHDGPHVSQDREAWSVSTDPARCACIYGDTVTPRSTCPVHGADSTSGGAR